MATYSADQGVNFGRWDNDTSRLMYRDVMPVILNGVNIGGAVADYGGANGLLKEFIPQAVSIDIDASKGPDIVEDVFTHVGKYDLIVMRYLLHYLTNAQVKELLDHVAEFHAGRLLIIQFINDDLEAKEQNSVNETKYFRTASQLDALLAGLVVLDVKRITYTVSAQFYRDRLNHPNPVSHNETVVGYYAKFDH